MLDPTSDHIEVTFREGPRWVPRYVADQLPDGGEEAYTMTYAEAMDYINKRQLADFANDMQGKFVDAHFRGLGR